MELYASYSVYAFVFVVMCGVHANGTALMFELTDRTRFCISERFEGPKEYQFEYRVIRGGRYDVDVSVKSPNGKVLHKKQKVKEGKFQFETSRGDYTFCFGNEFSTWAHKVIFFDLRPAVLDSLAGEAGVVKPFVETASGSSCDEVHKKMSMVVDYQRDYRLRELIGRHIAEGLHSHVAWWSIGQTLVILIAGMGQVFMLKRFFTDKVVDHLIKEDT